MDIQRYVEELAEKALAGETEMPAARSSCGPSQQAGSSLWLTKKTLAWQRNVSEPAVARFTPPQKRGASLRLVNPH